MLFAVLFTDNPERGAARAAHMADHLAFLERHQHAIKAAGPLRDPADGSIAGGLWLVEAEDADTVAALYRADPFWPTGLRRSVQVSQWTRVFAEGRRLI
jgi:uncharacterized protein YciI